MRLIDADELKEQLKLRYENAYKRRCETYFYKEKADGAIAAFLEAIRTLNNAPTVDVVPREVYIKDEKKQSDFYPNADEDGMVDVSDYPYTK